MEDNMLTPCVIWQEKLAALHLVDLSPAERVALDAHMGNCPKCTAAFNEKIDSLMRETFVSESKLELPDWLTQEDAAARLPPLPVRRLYQNLPPRFEHFLGRQMELASVVDGLNSFQSLLAIEGMGGVGKTTLAIEMAYQCLQGSDLMPNSLFDAAVWVSAAGRLDQKLWFSDVLSTIARVLDYHSVAQLSFEEKCTRVTELLHTYQTLVIIDNFDTIDDPRLLTWIQQIPEPSKVLVTSRDTHRLPKVWTLHLKGLVGDDALELIDYHARKLNLTVMESAEAKDLLHVTHGNPQAIAMVLGDLKSRGLGLHQVLDGLSGAGDDVLDHLFTRSWIELAKNLEARQILLAMSFFADSVSKEALSTVVGMDDMLFENALIRLVELSLIEVYGDGEETRYGLHPLTRAFVGTKLKYMPDWEQKARTRWIDWWLAFTKAHGGPDGMEWARQYDLIEEEWENLRLVCEWCVEHDQYETQRLFWHGERLLWMTSIYGYWKERLFRLRWIGQEAEKHGDKATAIEAMVEQGFTMTQMGQVEEAEKMLKGAWKQKHLVSLGVQAALAENLVQWHIRTNDLVGAQRWLETADRLVQGLSESERPRHKLTIKYYYGVMYIARGDRSRAGVYFKETLKGAREIDWQRCMIYVQEFLADIAKARGRYDEAEVLLKTGLEVAKRNKDRRRTAYYKRSLAYLVLQQGRRNKRDEQDTLNEVRNWAQQALDGFEHLGMQPEVGKLRRLLRRLEAAPSLPSAEEIPPEQTDVSSLMV